MLSTFSILVSRRLLSHSVWCLFITCMLLPYFDTNAAVLFDSESIFVDIRLPDTVMVSGRYSLVNSSKESVSRVIHYPFPIDKSMLYPCSISIRQLEIATPINFNKNNEGILFVAEIAPKDTVRYIICYMQKVTANAGRYILTTTQHWNRPLRQADFEVSIPANHAFKYVSYDVDTVFCCDHKAIYRFSRKSFMPEKDLIFNW